MTLHDSIAWKKLVTIVLVVVGVANLVVIDLALFSTDFSPREMAKDSPITDVTKTPNSECDTKCIEDIQSQLASLSAALTQPAVPTQSKTATPVKAASTVKEFYIPLGTGFTTNNQWEDVAGAEIMLDSSSYPNIKNVRFEAGLRIPVANGTVNARLYNVTDKHPVWFSDVSASTSNSTFASSGAVTLDQGNKLYRVQIQSTLQYPAYMDMARIKIIVK